VVAIRAKRFINQLMLLRFGFLNAHHISILLRKPLKEALSLRRPNSVGIAGNYSKHAVSPFLNPAPLFAHP
jgi:hypothetical protein